MVVRGVVVASHVLVESPAPVERASEFQQRMKLQIDICLC